MLKRILILFIFSLCILFTSYGETFVDGQLIIPVIVTSDLEMGTFSIDGDSSAGLVFDPDNDGVNEITMPAAGGITVGGTNERITFTTNGEYIEQNQDDEIEFQGVNGSDDTDIAFDLDGTSPRIYSPTDSAIQIDDDLIILDDKDVEFGSSTDSFFRWDTSQAKDSLQLGLNVGSNDFSGYFSIMEDTDIGNANRDPASTSADPVLRVYSSDATVADDYIEILQNQTDAIIKSGNGVLSIRTPNDKGLYLHDTTVTRNMFVLVPNSTTDQMIFGIRDDAGNQIILTNYDNRDKDHDHSLTTNPTLFIHSDLAPDTSNNQWGSFAHNQEDFVITTGVNVGTGTGATTDDNGIKLFPRGGSKGLQIGGAGHIAYPPTTFTFTTEVDLDNPLTSSLYLLDGDNDSENDALDLQNGTFAGQILTLMAAADIDANDTLTINMSDTTCTSCPAIVFDKVGENAELMWTGSTWFVKSLQDAL